VRLAVLPAALIAVVGAGVVAYVMSAGASGAPGDGGETVLWSVLGVALALVCAVVAAAAYFASAEARRNVERVAGLRRAVLHWTTEVRATLRQLERGEVPAQRQRGRPPQPTGQPQSSAQARPPLPPAGADAYEALAYELESARQLASSAVVDAAALVRSSSSESEEKVEVFVNLARRLQSLVHREIELLDELENEVEDPDLLKGLFHVDHLATRIRRHAENLAVLGGAVSRRQWSRPVTLTEVLRSSIAEVEQYSRVKLVPPIEGRLSGHAVADVIHLLAELVENASVFSSPQTQVLLRAQYVTSGLAVEVEDRGLGMTAEEQERMNAILSDPERIDVGELLQDGRIGLFVVSALAQRHGIVVRLQGNIYGGVQAVLVLPHELLGDSADARGHGAVPEQSADSLQQGAGSQPARSADPVPSAPQAQPNGAGGPDSSGAAWAEDERMRPGPAVPAAAAQAQPGTQAGQFEQTGQFEQAGWFERTRPHPQAQSPQPHPDARPLQQQAPYAHAGAEPQLPPQQGGEGAGAPVDERPALPKRRRQEHLAPELRDAPPAPGDASAADAWDAAEHGHDPGLMAAFQRGTSRAEQPDGTDGADGSAGTDGANGGYRHGSSYGDAGAYGTGAVPGAGAPHPAAGGDPSRTAR